jgi:hypothetical protein
MKRIMEKCMAKITFLLGLCGSGKSHLANQLNMATGATVFDSVLNASSFTRIEQCLRAGKDCIVEEISFCLEQNRGVIQPFLSTVPDLEIEWICFENDLESANWNVTHRKNKSNAEDHRRINANVHPQYTYPDGARRIPITRIAGPQTESQA